MLKSMVIIIYVYDITKYFRNYLTVKYCDFMKYYRTVQSATINYNTTLIKMAATIYVQQYE